MNKTIGRKHDKIIEKQCMNNKSAVIWLACGENCMPIDVLRRFKINSPSNPFSSCRSTVEHIEYHEETDYKNYLRQDFLIEANAFSEKCYLNLANKSSAEFNPGRHRFLELTHHNPFDEKDKETLERRIRRMLEARSKSDPHIFFYHHRSISGFRKEAKDELKTRFSRIINRYRKAKVLCYSQEIVKERSDRKIEMTETTKGAIHFCTIKNLKPWAGNDLDQFFGRYDEDLFTEMFDTYNKRAEELKS